MQKCGQNNFDHWQRSLYHFEKKKEFQKKGYKNKNFFMYPFLNLKKSKVHELNF